MRRFPWPDDVWAPSEKAVREAFRFGAYRVMVRIRSSQVFPAVQTDGQDDSSVGTYAGASLWKALQQQLTAGSDGVLLDGGASIRHAGGAKGEELLEVVSGGEDALDSLSYTINVTLAEAASTLGERELSVDSEGGIR